MHTIITRQVARKLRRQRAYSKLTKRDVRPMNGIGENGFGVDEQNDTAPRPSP